MKKELKKLVKLAEEQGWQVTVTGGNHLCWRSPVGRTVFTPTTPSEYRGLKNAKAWLRREGLVV